MEAHTERAMEPQELCEHLVQTTPAGRAWAYARDERGVFHLVATAGQFPDAHVRSKQDLQAAWVSGETRERALSPEGESRVVGLTVRVQLPGGDVLVRVDRDRGEATFTQAEIGEVKAAIGRLG